MNTAPILVTVHTRFDHFKRCIASLLNCREAKYSHLFISSDFQRNDEEKINVDLIRNYVKTLKGFKSVTPIFFDKNVGIDYASIYSVNKVFENYDQIIMLEDDIEVSPLFLNYINEGLDFYKNEKEVLTISGYSQAENSNEIYFSNAFNAWGFGTWKDKFKSFLSYRGSDVLFNDLKVYMKNKKMMDKINSLSIEYKPHFTYCLKYNKVPAFDHHFSFYSLINEFVHVYPNNSFVKNRGHDGSGLHTLKNKKIQLRATKEFTDKFSGFILYDGKVSNDEVNQYSNKIIVFIKMISIKFGFFDSLKKLKRQWHNFKL